MALIKYDNSTEFRVTGVWLHTPTEGRDRRIAGGQVQVVVRAASATEAAARAAEMFNRDIRISSVVEK